MIELEDIAKVFPLPTGRSLSVLQDITFQLPADTSIAIVGRSGSGKSTLMSLLSGLDRPTRGRIRVAGVELTKLGENALSDFRAKNVGIVFQSFHLVQHFTALGNVLLAAELSGIDRPRQRAEQALEEVGLGDRLDHQPTRLSGGEQQRVAIARALVSEPRLVLCDEPTGNLDPENAERIFSLLVRLRKAHHTTLVLITHDQDLAGQCHWCVHLDKGRVTRVVEGGGHA